MEINVRKLLLILVLVGLLAAGGYGLLRHPQPAPNPIVKTLAVPAAGQPVSITLTFADESTQWDWQPASCAEPLKTFITAPASVTMTLTDAAADQHLIATYPDLQTPNAPSAAAQCRKANTAGTLVDCRLGIRQAGAASVDLNVAAAAVMAYALQEYARPKTEAAYAARPAWAWANFQPAIVKEQSQWHACMTLSAQ